MKKKIGAILLVVALALALALPAAPAAAHIEVFPKTVDLIADGGSEATAIVVGTVSVWNDEVNLYVKYETTDGWEMTATHLEVALTEPVIPQNRKGNPKVGQFSRNEPHDPPVTVWEEVFNLADESWPPCTDLVIAAQADVQKLSDVITATLVTGAGTDNVVVIAEDPLNPGYPVVPPYGTPSPAVLTWVHGSWPSIAGAQWISSALYVENPPPNSWRLFTRNFSVPSNAVNLSGTLQITADNAEEVELNGTPVGTDGEVYGPFIDNHEWATILSHAVSPQPGTNTLEVMVRNYAGSSSPTNNPTGLIYKMDYEYQLLRTETAWGDGDRFTEPGNWATYFTYHVQDLDNILQTSAETATAELEDDPDYVHSGDRSVHLNSGSAGTGVEARIVIALPLGTTLGDIQSISWWTYLVSGYVPHVDIVLDKDKDTVRDDVLVAEGAYQNGDLTTGWATTTWFETFDGASATYPGWSGLVGTPSVTEVDDTTAVWLNSSGQASIDTLSAYKAGTAVGTVDSTTPVLALEIEVDNWVAQSEAYVDDIAITLS